MHWNGKAWSTVTSPDPSTGDNVLRGVSATTGTRAWAAGQSCTNIVCRTLILHWNGKAWSKIASPSPSPGRDQLAAVTATSGSNAWAVGQRNSRNLRAGQSLILHWNGTRWART